MLPGEPWPSNPRRDASSHQVVGDAVVHAHTIHRCVPNLVRPRCGPSLVRVAPLLDPVDEGERGSGPAHHVLERAVRDPQRIGLRVTYEDTLQAVHQRASERCSHTVVSGQEVREFRDEIVVGECGHEISVVLARSRRGQPVQLLDEHVIGFFTQVEFVAHADHMPDVAPQVVDVVEFRAGEAHAERLHRFDTDVPEFGDGERHIGLRDRHTPCVLVPQSARDDAPAHVCVDDPHPDGECETFSVAAHSVSRDHMPQPLPHLDGAHRRLAHVATGQRERLPGDLTGGTPKQRRRPEHHAHHGGVTDEGIGSVVQAVVVEPLGFVVEACEQRS